MKPIFMRLHIALLAVMLLICTVNSPVYAQHTVAAPYYQVTPNKTVCITIDDGYGYYNQKRILDTLRKYRIKCTFFIVGEALMRKPNLWKQAIKDGHEICYHSMMHKNLLRLSQKQIQQDIDQWNATVKWVLPDYNSPKLARLPGGNGARVPRVMDVFAKNGYKVIGWSVQNISGSVEANVSHIKYGLKKNSILLIHFDPVNASSLPKYAGWVKQRFKLSRVSDAFAPKPTPACTTAPTPAVWPSLPTAEAPTPEASPVTTPTPEATVSPETSTPPPPDTAETENAAR